MDYKKAILITVNERRNKLANARLLYLDLLRSSSELYEVEKQIRSLIIDKAHEKDVDDKMNELLQRKKDILASLNVPDEALNPPYVCEKCHDTGLNEGKPCSCIIRKCAADALNSEISFEQSDLSAFPTEERERINKVYTTARSFCEKFPYTNKLNLLFMGKCGSGKTFIASCIANSIARNGHSVLMLSAFALINRLHKYHTTFDESKLSYLEPLIDCELLIVDDLGTETMMKNVTVEYLFHIVNERMLEKKHTIFTTNLDNEMLRRRYGERTYSRLFGERLSIGFALSDCYLINSIKKLFSNRL